LISDLDLQFKESLTHTREKGQGHRSLGSEIRVETDGRTDVGDCMHYLPC